MNREGNEQKTNIRAQSMKTDFNIW